MCNLKAYCRGFWGGAFALFYFTPKNPQNVPPNSVPAPLVSGRAMGECRTGGDILSDLRKHELINELLKIILKRKKLGAAKTSTFSECK